MNIEQTLQLLNIQEVTTKRQKKNGTREFKLPVNCRYGGSIHVASFASGYVRRTKAGGYCPSWQLNKRCMGKPEYFKDYEWVTKNDGNGDYGKHEWTGKYRKFETRQCVLIPKEIDRLEYLINYCLKNYYIGYANMLSNGEFVPKWKYEDAEKQGYSAGLQENIDAKPAVENLSVIVNNERYRII